MGKVQPMLVPNLSYLKRILHKGMSGKDVKLIQQRLVAQDERDSVTSHHPILFLK